MIVAVFPIVSRVGFYLSSVRKKKKNKYWYIIYERGNTNMKIREIRKTKREELETIRTSKIEIDGQISDGP